MGLLDDLKQAATPAAPPSFKPGIVFQGSIPVEVTTPPLPGMETEDEFAAAVKELGYPIPEGYTLQLVEMQLVQHEAAWHRDEQGEDAVTRPANSFRYRFKVVPKAASADEDIAQLMADAKAAAEIPRIERGYGKSTGRSLVVSLADFQVGKAQDQRGGTPELLERSAIALVDVKAKIARGQYEEIILADVGDSTEGFESSPNADRTNDLSQTAQIRVWRRILWSWISELAPLTDSLTVVAVPSNHCRVRRGKQTMGDALDDWGIEVLSQVRDIASANPGAYKHVQFIQPRTGEEHVVIETLGGQSVGFIHGHQVNNPNQLPDMLMKNARRGVGMADMVVAGHFHHLRVIDFGDQQTLLVCPSNDAGSGWFQYSGHSSRAGVLTFEVTPDGWEHLDVVWTS